MSPPNGAPPAAASGKEITSVGPRWPRCLRLIAAIALGRRKAMDRDASPTPSASSTARARAATRDRASGTRTPSAATSTSRLKSRELRGDPAARRRIVGPVMMLADHRPGKLVLDDLELPKRQRRVAE